MATTKPRLEQFNSRFLLAVGADVQPLSEEEAEMDYQLYEYLVRRVGKPVVGRVGGLTYQFKPSQMVPQGTVTVPKRNHDDPETLLIHK